MKNTIGRCEICGLVDHHLDQGLCPNCAQRAITTPSPTTLAKAVATFAPIVGAAHRQGMLTDTLARRVEAIFDELGGWPIGYEAAWQGGER